MKPFAPLKLSSFWTYCKHCSRDKRPADVSRLRTLALLSDALLDVAVSCHKSSGLRFPMQLNSMKVHLARGSSIELCGRACRCVLQRGTCFEHCHDDLLMKRSKSAITSSGRTFSLIEWNGHAFKVALVINEMVALGFEETQPNICRK